MSRQYPVGIDLGTTFSAAAWVNESGRTEMVRNADGELLTPSIVLFDDRELVVGKEARSATTINPDMVAEWVKRDMGLPYYSRKIHGRRLPPEVIQACILQKLKDDVVRELGSIERAVITVPAYFDEPRRKRTLDAGEMAGLKILDIVNEPTAAALSFGETLGYLTPGAEPKEDMTLLVYDLGGGTFDVTLLQFSSGKIETLATDGDVMLGGHDWDLRLVDYIAARFKRLHKRDPREDPVIVNRALSAAIDAKHALTARARTIMHIEAAGQTVEVPVTRDQFDEMTADLLERTAYTTRQLLNTANMEWKDVSRVLLVGGSTRMPMVSRMLQGLSGVEPDHTVNPDEAVARGAALYAAYLLGKESGDEIGAGLKISNVNSHSLGIEGIDPETMRKKNVVLIPRNTKLPAKFKERFVTRRENQRSIAIQILEGESSSPEECSAIGRTVVRDLPEGLPSNWPIEVTFEYAENGRLTVTATVPGTHQGTTLDLERSLGVSDEWVSRWKRPIEEAAGFDEFDSMVQDVMDESAANREEPLSSAEIESMQADFGGPSAESTDEPSQPGGWTPFVAGPRPQEPEPEMPEEEDDPWNTEISHYVGSVPMQSLPHWVGMIGHVVAAVLGLTLGYLILCWLRPETFPFPWKL